MILWKNFDTHEAQWYIVWSHICGYLNYVINVETIMFYNPW